MRRKSLDAPNKTGWKGVQYAGGTTTLPTYTVDGGKGGIPVVVNAWDDPVYHGGEYVIGLGRDEYGSMTNPDGTPIKLATFSVSAPRSSNNTPVTARGPGVDEFVSSSGTAAGVFGISLDMMRSVGHFGRGMGKVLETGSRRLGVFGLLASGYNISTGNAGWRDYTDFGAGVATLTVEGAAAPWVAAAAGAFTLWELGTDLITPERPH